MRNGGIGGPRYLPLANDGGRLYCCGTELAGSGERVSKGVISAITSDGLRFELEPGYRMRERQGDYDTSGITAAEVISPTVDRGRHGGISLSDIRSPLTGRPVMGPRRVCN